MKIAINARLLIEGRKDGISRFTDETLKRICNQHPEQDFLFLFDRKFHQQFIYADNITPKIIYPQARHPLLYDIWFNKRLPKILSRSKADIFVSSDGFLPLNCKLPTVAVIHDLNFEHHPEFLPQKELNYYKKRFPLFAQQATHICTVSQFSKQDIIDTYHIEPEKISVVYNGVSENFKKIGETEKEEVREEFSDGKPYFIFTGSLHKRKNIVRMLKAFFLFKKENETNHRLLLVGKKMWWTNEMAETFNASEYKKHVIFLGQQPEKELNKLVAAAEAMIYVPLFEGFGIPPLEAMQSGVPVMASAIDAITEISGDATLLVDPLNIKEMAEGMKNILDPQKKKILIEKGTTQAKKYSWQKTADLFWQAIEKSTNQSKL